MPASLYRLAGRQHPVGQPAADVGDAPVVEAVEQIVATQVEQVDTSVETQPPEEVVAVETADITSEDISEPEIAAPVYPDWDASWTKTKLLGVAIELKLAVTIDSTKAEIVAALTAATRS